MRRIASPYSLLAVLVLMVLMIQARLWAPYWDTRNVQAILTWDAMGYYLYLPAQFIYHDLSHMAFIGDIMREYAPTGSFYQAYQVPGGPEGDLVMKYTCGLAVLQFPFFWLGHWAAALFGYPQDGFSAPYQIAIAFGGLAYALLGLLVLRRVLLRYFSDAVTTLTLVTIVLGTNYFQYVVFDGAMAHNYLFALYAILLWLTIRWHETPKKWLAAAIGLTLGLLVLIRPSEAVAVVIPLAWGIDSVAAARRKGELLLRHWPHVVLLAVFAILGGLPQPLYWKWATGHWLVYSYGDQKFNFGHPHLYQVLLSYKKGWLVYTPLMAGALAGFFLLWRQNRAVAITVLLYFLLNLWVVSAWDIWWYGGSIGQRALVQSYAALALPLAAMLAWVLRLTQRQSTWMYFAWPAFVWLVCFNLFQHWQYMRGIIQTEEMNKQYYWAIFDKTMPQQRDFALIDIPKRLPGTDKEYDFRQIARLDFENQPTQEKVGVKGGRGHDSGQSYYIDASQNIGPTIAVPVSQANVQPGQWLRASVWVFADWGAWGNKLVMSVERNGQNLFWHGLRLHNNLTTERRWNYLNFDFPVPNDIQPGDIIKVYPINEGGAGCYLDDMQLEAVTPKAGWAKN
ncbi:hypothetical protein F0P96_13975 [Hymenobacter busanensis]|uniref:Uncharacterized protein n=1 Tax=Hymenobacter busanensis TaxID=2607656 RepID=A0A7L4ZYF9_9BACT|nr:hypothetical protein [Hymenobacter busanensis]KAA9331351.1 hypothetical protein F0P96_13975 [Hymenobacter busanensis]QHJ08504.1 hypothetical protein GUY19_14900 [Hymenobacter busanensis]